LRGRVFATDMMIVTLVMSFSIFFAGVLTDHVDARIPIAICAGLTLVYGIIWRLITRRLIRTAPAPLTPSASPEAPALTIDGSDH
jgi:hypothetical protein